MHFKEEPVCHVVFCTNRAQRLSNGKLITVKAVDRDYMFTDREAIKQLADIAEKSGELQPLGTKDPD